MKPYKMAYFLLIILLSSVCFSKTVIISTGEYSPLAGKNIYKNGFVLDIIREAFNKSGHTVKYVFYPWARAYQELLDNHVDASAFWYTSERRKKYCRFSNKVFTEIIYFYYNKNISIRKWEKLQDLDKYRIGATRSFTYTDQFWDFAKKKVINIDISDTDSSNLKKLVDGRIDIFPCTKIRASFILKHHISPDKTKIIGHFKRPLRISEGHLLFLKKDKKSKKLLEDFNKGLEIVISEKIYENKYNQLLEGFYSKKKKYKIKNYP